MTDYKERARRLLAPLLKEIEQKFTAAGFRVEKDDQTPLVDAIEAELGAVAGEAEQREHDRHFDCEDDAKLLDCPIVKGVLADREQRGFAACQAAALNLVWLHDADCPRNNRERKGTCDCGLDATLEEIRSLKLGDTNPLEQ